MGKKVFKDEGCYYYQESNWFFLSVSYGTTRIGDY